MINQCDELIEVKKNTLSRGDVIFLKTCNSTYAIKVVDDGQYMVQGGWFDQNKLSPLKTKINGCTWGGSVIKSDVVAACGLSLEFGNRLITSRIEKIIFIPNNNLN